MRWADRKRARFRVLVLPYIDVLHGYATRQVRDPDVASDLTQEVCLRAWKSLETLRDEGSVRAWLYQILRGVLRERSRKWARRRGLAAIEPLDAAVEASLVDDDAFASLIAQIDGLRAFEALQSIPEIFAIPIELHDIEGFRYREIAEILDVPKGTVMSRISRGRRLLASKLTLAAAANPCRKASS